MSTRDMSQWQTAICKVVSRDGKEDIVVRGHRLNDLVGGVSFAAAMFLMLQGRLPSPAQARVLDALLVASIEHGIAPPSMISRCFASYGTSIQAAVGAGILAFGDRMGGLGEQLAQLMAAQLAPLGDPARIDTAQLHAAAQAIVAAARRDGGRVPGFGIPLHGADPRAPKLLAVARDAGTHGAYCRLAERIEAELAAARGGKAVPMNLDGVGAAIALDLGFDWRATRLFLLTARSVSMGAHFLEEQAQDTTWRHLRAEQIAYTGPEPETRQS
ncbi:MAG: citryl-CoA lyase [Alphaproteobacteria bacterium]|nr:citryl-CoA lyase [Alphaproteobacteria bacterium]